MRVGATAGVEFWYGAAHRPARTVPGRLPGAGRPVATAVRRVFHWWHRSVVGSRRRIDPRRPSTRRPAILRQVCCGTPANGPERARQPPTSQQRSRHGGSKSRRLHPSRSLPRAGLVAGALARPHFAPRSLVAGCTEDPSNHRRHGACEWSGRGLKSRRNDNILDSGAGAADRSRGNSLPVSPARPDTSVTHVHGLDRPPGFGGESTPPPPLLVHLDRASYPPDSDDPI